MLFTLALPAIGDSLNNIPIPSFSGYTIQPVEFDWYGAEGDYLAIFADLAIAPPE